VAGVNHLEIPAELAFIFSKLDGKYCFYVHIAHILHITATEPSKSKGVSDALTLQPYLAYQPATKHYWNQLFKNWLWEGKIIISYGL